MPAITAVGQRFIVAWNHGLVRLASISKDLDVLAASQIDTAGRDAFLPALARDGRRSVVSWATRDDPGNPFSYETTAFTARLSEDLADVSEPATVGPVGPEAPRAGIAIGAGRTIACWNRNDFVYVRDVETAESPEVISLAARRQVNPLLAAGTSEYAVLWQESTGSREDPWNFDSSVRLQFVSPGGARYLEDPMTLSEDGYGAVVAAGGDAFAAAQSYPTI